MSRNFDEIVPDEVLKQRSRFAPVEVPAPARPVWNWEELNAKFRPRLIAAGVIRFGLTQDDCEHAAQTVFLKVLAMNPRVRDPKAYLRAAFLNQCNNILQARERRGVGDSEPRSSCASSDSRNRERSRSASKPRPFPPGPHRCQPSGARCGIASAPDWRG